MRMMMMMMMMIYPSLSNYSKGIRQWFNFGIHIYVISIGLYEIIQRYLISTSYFN